ncbi:Xylosylphosphotransferase 1 [Hyphodiscus hymeniophilus]|uniref:Xylosylphosphotransferase 1 n=1 Tax=Hyphodiscus hymeniophilus TaxID=353542 RepID=A0A9P6VDS4_9HELO|nr:Xylosylphosphotransferase 1 [Hyphodiscus hymeniophilus]
MFKSASKLPHWQRESRQPPPEKLFDSPVNVPDTDEKVYHADVPASDAPVNVERDDDEARSPIVPIRKGVPPEEYAEDDSRHQDFLGTRANAEYGPPNMIQRERTKLVQQASEKLVEQHLAPAVIYDEVQAEKKDSISKKVSQNWDEKKFPPYSEYEALDEKGKALPDIVHVPFEDSTAEVNLQGWEDQWYSEAEFDITEWGKIPEAKIDFIYTWVNGSEDAFRETIYPYEVNSTLNDPEGEWLESHRVNRYRDWDELRYSIRSIEKYAGNFRNKIQILVNAVADPKDVAHATVENPANIIGRQRPLWLKDDAQTKDVVQILAQEEFFDENERGCLPTFNSLTIENQIFNTKSNTDRIFALSDDMLLGKPHAASDLYSPLFGPTMGFKTNAYSTVNPPTDVDARRFGEKPFLIYTSWLLNRRFGERKRKGQQHFGHSISRSVTREAIKSFPRPALQSTCQRFRGETGFQLYSWYVAFHYTIERHREALLWSYIVLRSDRDGNGNLGWEERQQIMQDLEQGMSKEGEPGFRKRMFYHMSESLEEAGIEAPKVNVDVQWTSLDGPSTIQNIECFEFNVNECLAPGFSTSSSDENHVNYIFNTASILDRVARQHPKCGDCLIKLLLNRVEKGLSPLLPYAETQARERETVIKALWKYQYAIVDPDAYFVMITDAEQVENVLFKRLVKRKGKVGQLCLNDDVSTEEENAVADVRKVMIRLLESMVPEPSAFEIVSKPDPLDV